MMYITKTELQKVFDGLNLWLKERHISPNTQTLGLVPNLFEELSEYYRAQTKEEKIDAICDICTFTINALSATEKEVVLHNFYNIVSKNPMVSVIDCIKDMTTKNISILTYITILNSCFHILVEELQTKPYLALMETIKEISSRTGKYNEQINKFVKDKGAYDLEGAQKLVGIYQNMVEFDDCWLFDGKTKIKKYYKADYGACKI